LGLRREGQLREVLRPEAHLPERRCSAGFPDVWAVAPEALRPEAERRVVLMELHLAPRLVRAAAVRPAVPAAARPSVVAARMVPVRAAVAQPLAEPMRALQLAEGWVAQPLAEAVLAQQLAEPAAWAEAAPGVPREQAVPRAVAVRPKVAQAVWGAAAVPQPVAASVAVELPPEERAGQDVAAALLQEVAAGERLPEVARDEVAERLPEARQAAVRVSEVRLRAAPDEPEVLPSAAAWAAPLSIRLREARPAPSPWARSAHARERLRTAQP
jgi:hypothetical protein